MRPNLEHYRHWGRGTCVDPMTHPQQYPTVHEATQQDSADTQLSGLGSGEQAPLLGPRSEATSVASPSFILQILHI